MVPGAAPKGPPKSVKWTKRIKSLPHRALVEIQSDDFLTSFFHSRDTLPGNFPFFRQFTVVLPGEFFCFFGLKIP
jgi:hypothetical protein